MFLVQAESNVKGVQDAQCPLICWKGAEAMSRELASLAFHHRVSKAVHGPYKVNSYKWTCRRNETRYLLLHGFVILNQAVAKSLHETCN